MPRRKYQVGDVFKFRLDEAQYGYGQIVAAPPRQLRYFAIFDLTTCEEMELEKIVSSRILVLAQSMEAKLDNGDWEIIGNAPVKKDIVFPEYKVLYPDGWMVERYDGTLLRTATRRDLRKLDLRTSFSPAALENALKAHVGLVTRDQFYDALIIQK